MNLVPCKCPLYEGTQIHFDDCPNINAIKIEIATARWWEGGSKVEQKWAVVVKSMNKEMADEYRRRAAAVLGLPFTPAK